MSQAPDRPRIFHITHVGNLRSIVEAGVLWSDAKRLELGLICEIVGMSGIKQRRLTRLRVPCHAGTKVGDYVPFYFCPRSVMLYLLHRGNHPEVTYDGGQGPILHLAADLRAVTAWADGRRRRWAFSAGNAGAVYTEFFSNLSDLGRVDWEAVGARLWQDPAVKEGKQAEFLLHESFPWELVEEIGVLNASTEAQVREILRESSHQPLVKIRSEWYY